MTSASSSTSGSLSPSLEATYDAHGESLSQQTLQSSATQDVFESVVKGRKSWKLRGGEVVWPPELEAALLEGLENYQPDDSRETRLLGRFPMRNKFISDYIFQKTGKTRSPKQVGSRLQQLRDTCGGKRLLKLLSPIQKPPFPAHRRTSVAELPSLCFDSSSETSSEPNTPVDSASFEGAGFPGKSSSTHSNICIDIIPEDGSYALGNDLDEDVMTPTEADPTGKEIIRFSKKPRKLSTIDPTITFCATSPMNARSLFNVMINGECIHSETVMLIQRAFPISNDTSKLNPGTMLYSCPLAPAFWKTIRSSSNPTRYVITQDVFQQPPGPSTSPPIAALVYSATYRFSFPAGYSPPPAPAYHEPIFAMDSESAHAQSCMMPSSSSQDALFMGSFGFNDHSRQSKNSSSPSMISYPPYDSMLASPPSHHPHQLPFSSHPTTALHSAHGSPMIDDGAIYNTPMVDPCGMQWRADTPLSSSSSSATTHSCFPPDLANYVL